jgi:hypothetical protein
MSDLITRVRALIGDPASATATFTDQQVQDWLDRTRQLVRYELLTPAPDIVPQAVGQPGEFDWATYVSRYTDWEADEVIQAGTRNSQNWALVTPLTSDELTGRWTFDVTLPTISTNIPGQLPPLFITGKIYDPYLAAAMLLEMWAAQLASTTYDFTSDGQSFRRSQIVQAKLQLAATYRRVAKPSVVQTLRSDLQASTAIEPVKLIGESNDFTR